MSYSLIPGITQNCRPRKRKPGIVGVLEYVKLVHKMRKEEYLL